MNGIKIGATKASGHSIGSNIYSTHVKLTRLK